MKGDPGRFRKQSVYRDNYERIFGKKGKKVKSKKEKKK